MECIRWVDKGWEFEDSQMSEDLTFGDSRS